jgi:hypothetical protein
MKIMHVLAALLLISSLATPATAQERTNKSSSRDRPRPERMWRADVDLRQQRRTSAIQKRILT